MAQLSWEAHQDGPSLEKAAVLDSIWLQNLSRNVNRVVWGKQAEMARLLKNHSGETKAFSEWSVSRARQMLFPCETPSVSRCSSGLEPSWHSCHCSPPASASHGCTECAPSPGTAASGSFWTPMSAVLAAVLPPSSTAHSIYYTVSWRHGSLSDFFTATSLDLENYLACNRCSKMFLEWMDELSRFNMEISQYKGRTINMSYKQLT